MANDDVEEVVAVPGDDVAEHAETVRVAAMIAMSGMRRDGRPRAEEWIPFKVGTPTSHHAAGLRLSPHAGWTSKTRTTQARPPPRESHS